MRRALLSELRALSGLADYETGRSLSCMHQTTAVLEELGRVQVRDRIGVVCCVSACGHRAYISLMNRMKNQHLVWLMSMGECEEHTLLYLVLLLFLRTDRVRMASCVAVL